MSATRKSISVQSQLYGNTQIVVLVVTEQDSGLKKAITRSVRRVKRVTRKFVRYITRNWIFILIGLWLTSKAIDSAYKFRGYEAVGGEYLVLPVFLLTVEGLRRVIWFIRNYGEEME